MFDKADNYVIEAAQLRDLWRIACRFNDGTRMDPNERRDLAQAVQAKLQTAVPLEAEPFMEGTT